MKILLIHNKYLKYSGEEAVVESQVNFLRTRGHEVVTYFRESIEIEEMSFGRERSFFSALYNKRSINEVTRMIKQELPDIVHIHNLYPLISPAILPSIKKMGIPIVMTVHNYRLLCPNGLFFQDGNICEKCTGYLKEWNCVAFNCEGSVFKSFGYAVRNFWSRYKKYYHENVNVFLCLTYFQKKKLQLNGFDQNEFRILPNCYSKKIHPVEYNGSEKHYVAFAGRISPEKGIRLLLDAAKKLPHIKFKLAGEGDNEFINKLEVPKNVDFVGMLSSEDLDKFYSKSKFFVLPSIWYEGFPMVLPEAMSKKLPIIAPDMAGYPEIVKNEFNGLLFKPNNVSSLMLQIERLWTNDKLCIEFGLNGFKKLKENYSQDKYFDQLIGCYQDLKEN